MLELYAIGDGEAAPGRDDPTVVMCVDEFGQLNLMPYPGQQWAPAAVAKGSTEASRRRIRRATYKRPHGVRHQVGQLAYPGAKRLLINADAGGSNGYRVRLWKIELAKLATEIVLPITVCHFPPGTSKWNKIEHRPFSHIAMNWRVRPQTSHQVVVDLISATATRIGLTVHVEPNIETYPRGIKVIKAEVDAISPRLKVNTFHGDWNYTLDPRTTRM